MKNFSKRRNENRMKSVNSFPLLAQRFIEINELKYIYLDSIVSVNNACSLNKVTELMLNIMVMVHTNDKYKSLTLCILSTNLMRIDKSRAQRTHSRYTAIQFRFHFRQFAYCDYYCYYCYYF